MLVSIVKEETLAGLLVAMQADGERMYVSEPLSGIDAGRGCQRPRAAFLLRA